MQQKSGFANEEVMEEYLGALLSDKPIVEAALEDPLQRQSVAKLLETAEHAVVASPSIEAVDVIESVVEEIPDVQPQPQAVLTQEAAEPKVGHRKELASEFQALFFQVAGLTLAVPLTELGGIHQLEKIGPLFGKPSWFKGVMLHREEKLNVVDTAKWVMPEKYDEKLAESLNYQYLIMLDDSGWGLACESLVNTATLLPDDVKWRAEDGKRPWLAGIVKDKMCALIDVNKMIAMLNQGMGSNDK